VSKDREEKSENEKYMREALKEAKKAAEKGEIPIGAVIVQDGKIIARGRNRVEAKADPTFHAEMTAIRRAAKYLGGWRLRGCTMYVTAEPCSMCAGAAVLARLDKVCAGTDSPKNGACGSVRDILSSADLNHRVAYEDGILKEECAAALKTFFSALRKQ
jgi:tRNA(adenine34) deaminase